MCSVVILLCSFFFKLCFYVVGGCLCCPFVIQNYYLILLVELLLQNLEKVAKHNRGGVMHAEWTTYNHLPKCPISAFGLFEFLFLFFALSSFCLTDNLV